MSNNSHNSPQDVSMFRAPIHRSMRTLNRELFKKQIPAVAAAVNDPRNLFKVRQECAPDMLNTKNGDLDFIQAHTLSPCQTVSWDKRKLITLHPKVKLDNLGTQSPATRKLVEDKVIELLPYTYNLSYENWKADEILSAVLPEELLDGKPAGFALVGHIAHLNLKAEYLPYKHLIAEVILDKSEGLIQTVVNKIDDVGSESQFRTFPMEVLAGKDDMNVEVQSEHVRFKFNFATVYWNTKLSTEHERVIRTIRAGQAVCDVMAGVGPFSLPAAKVRETVVYANDLNPDCFKGLTSNAKLNKVAYLVRCFNMDGREFIKQSAKMLIEENGKEIIVPVSSLPHNEQKRLRAARKAMGTENRSRSPSKPKSITPPKVFSHYIMNLPASAVEFVANIVPDAFQGIYHGHEDLFAPHTSTPLPLAHVYIFNKAFGTDEEILTAGPEICETISKHLGRTITLESVVINKASSNRKPASDTESEIVLDEGKARIFYVRHVSQNKAYFCATFRIPGDVIFAKPVVG